MRYSLYNDVHKGIRRELTRLLLECGSCDPHSSHDVARLCDAVSELRGLLEEHAGHEEQWVEPAIRTHAAALAEELANEHVRLHEQLAAADAKFAGWRRASDSARTAAAADCYAALGKFVAAYLAHMTREEHEAMPALWAALDDGEIFAIAGRLRGAIPPARMAQWLGLMLPAMNVIERTALFAGMKMQAPPEVVDGLGQLAARVLSADEWADVRARAQL